jgi:[acyl-carrier-protein] S-malonyltransferase
MGLDFYQEFDFVRELFDMAEEISKRHISRLCFKGPMEALTETVNLQPAITAANLAVLMVLEKEGLRFDAAAGHSLGEYSALCAARTVTREDCFRLVYERGALMHRESLKHRGAMSAVVGLPIDIVGGLVDSVSSEGIVSVANHNTETQIVITGEPEPVKKVSTLAAAGGARAIPLKVSGAWHSELIRGAEADFMRFLEEVPFDAPKGPVIHNVTAGPENDPGEIRLLMARQLCSPVRWYDSMGRLLDEGVDLFVEVGPGRVLAGLAKKIIPRESECRVINVNSLKTLEAALKEAL